MPLWVRAFASYYTGDGAPRPIDRNGQDFVHALKGEEIKGNYANIPFKGGYRKIIRADARPAIEIFTEWVADELRALNDGPYVLVPVPPCTATRETPDGHRTDALAQRIVLKYGEGAQSLSLFWWKVKHPSTRQGGSRDPNVIFQNLLERKPPYPQGTYVLLDDVMTSGGHLQACAAKLRALGLPLKIALCGGRTFHTAPDNPFGGFEIELPDFIPK